MNRIVLVLPLVLLGIAVGLQSTAENAPNNLYRIAQGLSHEGRTDEAIQVFRGLIESYPESDEAPAALWDLATLYYVDRFDVPHSMELFHRLVQEHPESELAFSAILRLASLSENDLGDSVETVSLLSAALETPWDSEQRERLLFRLGNAHFRLAQFDDAEFCYRDVLNSGIDIDLAQEAQLRLGAIYQLRYDHSLAVPHLQAVLEQTENDEYRLQAQLELIESYEFLNNLPEAVRIAESISAVDFPNRSKEALLARLEEKRRYYEPQNWKGRR